MNQRERADSASVALPVVAARAEINLRWLVRVRWLSLVMQLLVSGSAVVLSEIVLDWPPLLTVFALGALSNAVLMMLARDATRRTREASNAVFGVTMLIDTVLLTLVLALSGGPSNPFSVLYLVHIVLTTMLLPSSWSTMIVIASVLAFLVQFMWHVDVPGLSMHGHSHLAGPRQMMVERSPTEHHAEAVSATGESVEARQNDHAGRSAGHDHHTGGGSTAAAPASAASTTSDANTHDAHLRGMFIAFAVAAAFISWFVQRINRDLESLMRELDQERRRRTDAERLRSLGTLAAGAAHELATPLSTIRLIAGELLHQADMESLEPGGVKRDLADMQVELARCSRILEQMAVRSGDVAASLRAVSALELAELILHGLPGSQRVKVDASGSGAMVLPADGVAHAVRSVLKNALQADPGTVDLTIERQSDALRVEVRDRGVGMEPAVLARFGEPFFTTRREGEGMGLGAYLTRRVAEDLGGTMNVESAPGHGTTITLLIPVNSSERTG